MKWAQATAMVLAGGLLVTGARAGVTSREETAGGHREMILENELARLVVLPDPGGTVVEFVNKKTGLNFVYGGDNVRQGKLGGGWKDSYWLESLDQLGKAVYSLPYKGEFKSGPGYKSIVVTCDVEGQRFEREMRLPDASAELTTLQKITNIGPVPRRLQCRWHTYSTLDDPLASNSCVVVPGPAGEARKCFVGSGWDHQFITDDGFWLAANYKSGQGIWMTFKKAQSSMQITWTDYKQTGRTPARGAYLAEPLPQPTLAQPGQSVMYESTFYPFTLQDAPDAIPLGMLSEPGEKERARQFLARVKPNLAAIGPYTMTPGEPPGGLNPKPDENRFSFSHRRRDRFALQAWGILDGMMDISAVQEKPIRCRYYARLFDAETKPVTVSFRLQALDAHGKVVQEQTRRYTIDPAAGRELDVRDDVAIAGLPDGLYQFVLDGRVEGGKEPIHVYIENCRLVGQAKPAYEKGLAERAAAPLVRRPFVEALAKAEWPAPQKGSVTVPLGVEEGAGLARQGWPVRCGVPFAQGLLAKDAAFEVAGPDGKAVPLQTFPMATWLDGSLKWLLVDFPADVPAGGHVFYTLKSTAGKAPAATALAEQKGDLITVAGNSFNITTGKVFGLFGPEDLWWEDGAGQRYYFRVKGEESGVVVEENGVNRAVVKATGWYVNAKDRAVCLGELRMEYYRGQPFVKLYHTVTFAGDPWAEKLGRYGIRLQAPQGGYEFASVELDGKSVSGKQIALIQANSDGAELTVDGKASSGTRSLGAVAFGGKAAAPWSVYHRHFWQMAPKKLVADAAAGTVTFSYWPAESGAMSFLPREDGWIPSSSSPEAIAVGLSRTHEIVIDAGAGAVLADSEKRYSEPVLAIAPPKYLAQTKALLHLSPYNPERYPNLERHLSDTIDFYASQRELFGWYGEWVYGGVPNLWNEQGYHWNNFGRYAWILNEEDIVDGPWLCYQRSGDRKYLAFAEINTRHLMEVGTIRWNPAWPQFVGLSRRHHECLWLSTGDTGHSMLDPFLDYYYATGYRPARDAAVRMGAAMAKVTSGEWRYLSNPVAGLARLYLDTQNPFYKEHADRLWNTLCFPERNDWWLYDHGDRMTMWYSQLNPQCKALWKEWTLNPEKKGRFQGADVLSALFLETGDLKYAQAVQAIAQPKIPTLTQHVMADIRAACYSGEAEAALRAPPAPGK